MFWLFLMWTFLLKQAYTFVLQDSYNILLKDSVHYKFTQTINYYEMINKISSEINMEDKNMLKALKRLAKVYEMIKKISSEINMEDKNMLKALKRLAKQEFDKEVKQSIAPTLKVFQIRQTNLEEMKSKLIINISTPSLLMSKGSGDKQVTYDKKDNYDYNNLNNEYYIEILNGTFSNKTYNINKDKSRTEQSTYKRVYLNINEQNDKNEELRINDVKKKRVEGSKIQKQLTRDFLPRVCYIIKIWILVYTVIAVPMWSTRGWCCCCLRCKNFLPQRTIEEAKKYLILYPPGVFNTNKRLILYEPSQREKEKYEEIEHFIRTL